jgi:LysR family transcriptional regulator, glycine cleavage system transcriptional activator
MLPDLESLRCFVNAAEQLHFGRAARSTALSPTAFGERIRRLEDLLGAPLFSRTTRSIRLTSAGQRLLPQALRCIEDASACYARVHDAASTPYALTVGTRYELGLSWLVPNLDALELAQPERTLHLCFGDTPDLLPRLQRREIDAIVTSARVSPSRARSVQLHEERYVLVGAPRLLADTPLSRARDAVQHTLIDTLSDLPLFRYFLDVRPSDETWSFHKVQLLGTIGAVRSRVIAGRGVAVLPHYFVREDIRQKRLQVVFPKLRLPSDWFRLIWNIDHPHEAHIGQLGVELQRIALR